MRNSIIAIQSSSSLCLIYPFICRIIWLWWFQLVQLTPQTRPSCLGLIDPCLNPLLQCPVESTAPFCFWRLPSSERITPLTSFERGDIKTVYPVKSKYRRFHDEKRDRVFELLGNDP